MCSCGDREEGPVWLNTTNDLVQSLDVRNLRPLKESDEGAGTRMRGCDNHVIQHLGPTRWDSWRMLEFTWCGFQLSLKAPEVPYKC